jgi:hypothetical protein
MEVDSTRFTVRILIAALVVALAAFLVLWGLRDLSVISAFLASIVTFLISAIGFGVIVAAIVALLGRGAARQSMR